MEELGIFDSIQQVFADGNITLATNVELNNIFWLLRLNLINFIFECSSFLKLSYKFKYVIKLCDNLLLANDLIRRFLTILILLPITPWSVVDLRYFGHV